MDYLDADQTERARMNDTTFLNDLMGVTAEYSPDSLGQETLDRRYIRDPQGTLVALRQETALGTDTYFCGFNALGSVVKLTGPTAARPTATRTSRTAGRSR